jgi:hypothetical protein
MPLGANKVALYGASADTGTAVLLSTATASSSASIEFTLPTAYKQVTFGFYNVTPATDVQKLTFQTSTDGGSSYGVTVTSTAFRAYHSESGSASSLEYDGGNDLAQSTSFNPLTSTIGNGADESASGQLFLYNPASTTYVKHWVSTFSCYEASDYEMNQYHAGYFNDGSNDLTNIQFKMSSGNISTGTIKMWGIQ